MLFKTKKWGVTQYLCKVLYMLVFGACLSCSPPIRICLPVAGKMVSVHLYLRAVYLFGLGLVELIWRVFCVYSTICVKEAGQHMSGAAGLLLLHPFTESWLHQRQHGSPEAGGWFHYKITAENYQHLSITAAEKPAHTHSVLFHFVNFFLFFNCYY